MGGIFIALALIFLCCLIIGIHQGFGPGMADYEIELPGDYKLYRTSAHQIHVGSTVNWESAPRIPPKIIAIAWDSRYVIAIQQLLVKNGRGYEYPDDNVKSYWILDTKVPKCYGPLNKERFEEKRTELLIDEGLRMTSPDSYCSGM
jgi:hypothetical protein